jgi:hypothetical protein
MCITNLSMYAHMQQATAGSSNFDQIFSARSDCGRRSCHCRGEIL